MIEVRAKSLGGWLVCSAALLAALPAAADDEARRWLHGMSEALAAQNYQGELLHLANGSVEKLRVLHRVRDGRIAERLVSLSGNGREMVRNDAEVQCYLPDQRRVVVESYTDRGPLLGTLPSFDDRLEDNYHVTVAGRLRSLLGSQARVIAVRPKDGFRFGYRIWIEERTMMPVRTDLCDAQGRLLEQVLFTSLAVGGTLPDTAFRPDVDATGFSWVRQGHSTLHATSADPSWQLLRLPPGFRLSSSGEQLLPGSEAPVTHLVLSDGLASVSVFIEEPPAPPRIALEGEGRVGSAFAYAKVVAGHQVTAVGEVPRETVQFIASGVAQAGHRDPPARTPGLALAPPRSP
jgi:sigma-E factor negative regulatory protein RseB